MEGGLGSSTGRGNWRRSGARITVCRLFFGSAVAYISFKQALYPIKHGSTFVIITLKNTFNVYSFCTAVIRKEIFTHA